MIKQLYFTLIAAFAVGLFSGCSDNDVVLMPLNDIERNYKTENSTVCLNGDSLYKTAVTVVITDEKLQQLYSTEVDNSAEVKELFDGEIQITYWNIPTACLSDNPDHYIERNSLTITVNAKSVDDGVVIFSSDDAEVATSKGNFRKVKAHGSIRAISNGKSLIKNYKIESDLHISYANQDIIGKTYELKMDDESIQLFIGMHRNLPIEELGLTYGELPETYAGEMAKNFIDQTGFDAIRFKFSEDGVITTSFREVSTGKYIRLDSIPDSRYDMCAKNSFTVFSQEKQVKYITGNMGPFKDPYVDAESSLYVSSGYNECMLAVDYKFTLDGKLVITPVSINYEPVEHPFLRTWEKKYWNDDTSFGFKVHTAMCNAVANDDMSFTPRFIATPAE